MMALGDAEASVMPAMPRHRWRLNQPVPRHRWFRGTGSFEAPVVSWCRGIGWISRCLGTGDFEAPVVSRHRWFRGTGDFEAPVISRHFEAPVVSRHRWFRGTGGIEAPVISRHRWYWGTGGFEAPVESGTGGTGRWRHRPIEAPANGGTGQWRHTDHCRPVYWGGQVLPVLSNDKEYVSQYRLVSNSYASLL